MCALESIHWSQWFPATVLGPTPARTQTLGKREREGSHPHCGSFPACGLNAAGRSRGVGTVRSGPTAHLWPLAMHQVTGTDEWAKPGPATSEDGVWKVPLIQKRRYNPKRSRPMAHHCSSPHQVLGSWQHLSGSSCTLLFSSSSSIVCVPFKVSSSFNFNLTVSACFCAHIQVKLILHGNMPVQETNTQIYNYSCIIQELFAYSKQAIILMKCQMI